MRAQARIRVEVGRRIHGRRGGDHRPIPRDPDARGRDLGVLPGEAVIRPALAAEPKLVRADDLTPSRIVDLLPVVQPARPGREAEVAFDDRREIGHVVVVLDADDDVSPLLEFDAHSYGSRVPNLEARIDRQILLRDRRDVRPGDVAELREPDADVVAAGSAGPSPDLRLEGHIQVAGRDRPEEEEAAGRDADPQSERRAEPAGSALRRSLH